MGSLIFSFSDESDKLSFDARLKVALSGLGEAEAEIHVLLSELGGKGHVKFHALQLGGNPSELSKVIDSSLLDCRTDNQGPCFSSFATMVDYARDDFPKQFLAEDGTLDYKRFRKTKPQYRTYVQIDPELENLGIKAEEIQLLHTLRDEYAAQVLLELGRRNYVRAIQSSVSSTHPEVTERAAGIIDQINERMLILNEGIDACNQPEFDGEFCRRKLDEAYLNSSKIKIDMSVLNFTRKNLLDFCGALQSWQSSYEGGNLTEMQLEALFAMESANLPSHDYEL